MKEVNFTKEVDMCTKYGNVTILIEVQEIEKEVFGELRKVIFVKMSSKDLAIGRFLGQERDYILVEYVDTNREVMNLIWWVLQRLRNKVAINCECHADLSKYRK